LGIKIPTTQESTNQAKSIFETNLGQDIPLARRAFVRVTSAIFGFLVTGLYKFGVERALQNLALTATNEDLERIGREYLVIKKPAVSTVLNINLPATDGTIIPITRVFVGDENGVRYSLGADSPAAAGGSTSFNVTAQDPGVAGNLLDDSPLTIDSQVSGADTTATVVSTITIGAEEEDQEVYRVRVLDAIRTKGGGGNAADYRSWSEQVSGVARAYPYAGRDIDDPVTDSPPDRIVYVEADTTIDPDGLAPQSLLDQVRVSITTDPVTGKARQPLGLTDDTLFVNSITRIAFFVTIRGLLVDPNKEAQLKSSIDSSVETYFRSIEPFVEGIDFIEDRNDFITDLTISSIVQAELSVAGASAQAVAFGLTQFSSLPTFVLGQREKAKSAGVDYE